MSVLFFKRFLQRPFQIASIVPSSKGLVERVASKMDFSQPRVIAEYGPGEGVHSREIARRMSPDSHLLLFELDPAFSHDLERQFARDRRVLGCHCEALRLIAPDGTHDLLSSATAWPLQHAREASLRPPV